MTRQDRRRSLNSRMPMAMLGGGCEGLSAALHFDKTLTHDPDVEVTRVHREHRFLFTPLLHEVAASDLDVKHLVNPIRNGSDAWSSLTALVSARLKDLLAMPATTRETTRECIHHDSGDGLVSSAGVSPGHRAPARLRRRWSWPSRERVDRGPWLSRSCRPTTTSERGTPGWPDTDDAAALDC
jgi:hypothetical protein